MRIFRIAVLLLVGLPAVLSLHWCLPSRDIVQIVGVEVKRMEHGGLFASETETGARPARDVRLIQALWPDGDPRTYRNEDTAFGFPWYFKFDSGDVQSSATGAISTREAPRWMVVSHYGWRIDFMSLYPNVLSIRDAEGAEEDLFPWFNVVFLGMVLVGFLSVWRILQMLWRAHVDPVVSDLEAEASEARGRFRRWWGRLWR